VLNSLSAGSRDERFDLEAVRSLRHRLTATADGEGTDERTVAILGRMNEGELKGYLGAKSPKEREEVLVHCAIEIAPHLWSDMRHGQDEPDRVGTRPVAGDHA
jgi:hypothetical protein